MKNLRSRFWDSDTDQFQQLIGKILRFLVFLSLSACVVLATHALVDLNRVQHLTIAAGLKDGESFLFAEALAKVVSQRDPKLQIAALETAGTSDNLARLQTNAVQLAMAQADIPAPAAAQLVSLLFPDVYQLIVTEQSGIRSVPDLRGKRVALPPRAGGQYKSFRFLAEHYGLNPDDARYTPMVDDEAADAAFRNNQVDAVFHVRPPGNQAILGLVRNGRGRLLSIDQAAAMKLKQPALDPTAIPKGTYQGTPPIPATDQPTVAVQRLLLANKDVDKQLIQRVTTLLYECRQDLVNILPLAASISPPSTFVGTGLPIHPGAQAYYDREKPTFIEEHAQVFEFLLTLSILITSGFWQLKLRIEQQQKEKSDDYIREVVALMDVNDCIQEVATLLSPIQLSTEAIQRSLASISEKFEKVQAEAKSAEISWKRRKTSERSVQSFRSTLRLIHSAIEGLGFMPALQQIGEANPQDDKTRSMILEKAGQDVQRALANRSTTPKLDKLLHLKHEIRRDLDAIFKRSVEALVEERVSSESFQSFRTVWQIAISDVDMNQPSGLK